jgi:hypothetical protein
MSKSFSQPKEHYISIIVAPFYPDWTYTTGEQVTFNVLSAPKEFYLAPDTGHWIYPEQRAK